MKRVFFVVLAVGCVAITALPCVAGRRDTDTNAREITLNKHQLACLAVATKEMQRRGWPFRDYQVVITDEGSSYSIAFMDDPLDMTTTGGNGIQWYVRKKDLKIVRGPIFYR